jgi:NADPH:quinone reductase
MKAAAYDRNGGPEVLEYRDVPEPACPPIGVKIAVEAVSIEGGDTLNRARGDLVDHPHVVGYCAAGRVIEVGNAVHGIAVGDRVATVNTHGSHAAIRVVPYMTVWKVPDELDIAKAAAIPVAIGTAHECLFFHGGLKAGETVLVQAGASALGIGAIQLAKRAGARTIATASSDARLERLMDYGLDEGVNYAEKDAVTEVMHLTGGRGVDLVVDPVGGETLQASINMLAQDGRVSFVGNAGREPMIVDVGSMMHKNARLQGVFLGAQIITSRVHTMISELIAMAARGDLAVPIDREFHLSEAAEAHAYIESRKAVGRVILRP